MQQRQTQINYMDSCHCAFLHGIQLYRNVFIYTYEFKYPFFKVWFRGQPVSGTLAEDEVGHVLEWEKGMLKFRFPGPIHRLLNCVGGDWESAF